MRSVLNQALTCTDIFKRRDLLSRGPELFFLYLYSYTSTDFFPTHLLPLSKSHHIPGAALMLSRMFDHVHILKFIFLV